jgi:hypothetical protein
MELPLPEYIEARIRQRPPDGLPVVPGSTPVVAFGDVRNATVATLGWNPSKLEFLDSAGNELTGQERRLETLSSLGAGDLSSAKHDVIHRVFQGCNDYFQLQPYRKWFGVLEKVLHLQDVSYYNGTACHLDFVQWATDPTWRDLQRAAKQRLIGADLPFLRQQLAQEHIQLLLLNGSGIAKACSESLGFDLTETQLPGRPAIRLFVGRTPEGVRVIGWNLNLQSSFGVSNAYINAVGMAIQQIHSRS